MAERKRSFKLAVVQEKLSKINNLKKIGQRGISTKTEESFLLLDLAKKQIDAEEAKKEYQLALLNIAQTVDELHKVKIHEQNKL